MWGGCRQDQSSSFLWSNGQSAFSYIRSSDRLYLLKVLPAKVVKQFIVHLDTYFSRWSNLYSFVQISVQILLVFIPPDFPPPPFTNMIDVSASNLTEVESFLTCSTLGAPEVCFFFPLRDERSPQDLLLLIQFALMFNLQWTPAFLTIC